MGQVFEIDESAAFSQNMSYLQSTTRVNKEGQGAASRKRVKQVNLKIKF